MNILISSAGRRVALVNCFKKALKKLKIIGKVIAIDISNTAPALYAADKGYIVPRLSDDSFLESVYSIIKEENISLIIPTIDPELPLYAEHRNEIRKKTGAIVAVSDLKVIDICNDKYLFFEFLKSAGIPTPLTMEVSEAMKSRLSYPLFAKPRNGFASINTFAVSDRDELGIIGKRFPDILIQEYIKGREFTIDLLSDFEGKVISVVPRERIEIRAGEVTRSKTEKNKDIIMMSKAIAEKLGSTGAITLQCILKNNIPYFFEINPRVGGGLPASIAAGADTPLKLIKLCIGIKLRPVLGRFSDNHYMLRYDEAIFRTSLIPGGISSWRKS